ncbi:5-deoxy-glucuronate isomerase [Lactovum odontotermitis]
MVQLKREKIQFPVTDKVKLLHHITKENSLFDYIEAQVFQMEAGGSYSLALDGKEVCAVALTGKYSISDGSVKFDEVGTRQSVFEKVPTDSVYVPANKTITITCTQAGKIILCFAPASSENRKTTFIPAGSNSIEQRGKYNNKRQVHNILDDQSTISEKLLIVEVYTSQANWSSYPPHKHDQDNLPDESFLEEAYYHEMNADNGFVFQRVYTDDRLIDETMTVYNEEMVLVPRGYHPVAVPDGYESYYLNIMAGPVKLWKFHNAPEYEWIISRK